MSDDPIVEEGRRVIALEAAGLQATLKALDGKFSVAVSVVASCKGKIVTTAVGKSGFIARKLASTFASLSVPAVFVHPTEGLHGDLGLLHSDDIVIAISHSGNTEELRSFLTAAKLQRQPKIITIVGREGGSLDELADVTLETCADEEACGLGLAPTTSSTAALALGDALAITVGKLKGVQAKDFAAVHPAGQLGKRLYTPVAAVMRTDFPRVQADQLLKDVVTQITAGGIGLTLVEERASGRLGVLTDGDIRRAVQWGRGWTSRRAGELMSCPPRTVSIDALGMDALKEMETHRITCLVVVDGQGAACGVVHLHDILRHGLGLSKPIEKSYASQQTDKSTHSECSPRTKR